MSYGSIPVENLRVARQICEQAGIFCHCAACNIVVSKDDDATKAYALGNSLFSKRSSLVMNFHDRREMTDAIKAVFDEEISGECCCDQKEGSAMHRISIKGVLGLLLLCNFYHF